jgi:hypothetical protein
LVERELVPEGAEKSWLSKTWQAIF